MPVVVATAWCKRNLHKNIVMSGDNIFPESALLGFNPVVVLQGSKHILEKLPAV